jgi:hypothetical protein
MPPLPSSNFSEHHSPSARELGQGVDAATPPSAEAGVLLNSCSPKRQRYRSKKFSPRHKPRGWQRNVQYWVYRIVRLQGSPDAIARGLAAGVFSGWFPWFGFQIIIAVLLATMVRGNRLAAAIATWVSNPFTYVPIFAFNYQIGQWLLPGESQLHLGNITSRQDLMNLGSDILLALVVGCVVVGLAVSFMTYGLGWRLVHRLRRRRFNRRPAARQD